MAYRRCALGSRKRINAPDCAVFWFVCKTHLRAPHNKHYPVHRIMVNVEVVVYYESQDEKKFTARYGSLSDGSLGFVRIRMPNGREYTLPQIVSGSGARYTDDREIVWWEHRGTVRVDVRGAGGEWVTKYSGLKVVHDK